MTRLSSFLSKLTDERIIPAVSMSVGKAGDIVFSGAYGSIYETEHLITNKTKFDIASMTKVLTGICFVRLVEERMIGLHEPICRLFPELDVIKPIEKNGIVIGWCDAGKINWFQALTHTTGMGWTRQKTRPSLPNLDKGLEDIFSLPFAYSPGTHVVYSDLPFILMGKAMEKVTGKSLEKVVEEIVCKPLGLLDTSYNRISNGTLKRQEIVPTEYDTIFRKKRVWGEVHDENAFLMDGVAAHAGIFSTSEDICRLMMEYGACEKENGLLKTSTVKMMIKELVEDEGDRRGLLWQLSGRNDKAYTKYLSAKAYGHAGFTGCFAWNDPEKEISIVLLSNDVYNGRENRHLFEYRSHLMELVVDEIV